VISFEFMKKLCGSWNLSFPGSDGKDFAILACTVLTESPVWQTDGRTELRWLRRAKAVAAFARKKSEAKSKFEHCPLSEIHNWLSKFGWKFAVFVGKLQLPAPPTFPRPRRRWLQQCRRSPFSLICVASLRAVFSVRSSSMSVESSSSSIFWCFSMLLSLSFFPAVFFFVLPGPARFFFDGVLLCSVDVPLSSFL